MESFYHQWKTDEVAPFEGWDFSYIRDRVLEDDPPWDYPGQVRKLIHSAGSLLDMGTGGGEMLAALAPLPTRVVATEGYKPNVDVARRLLEPLGVVVIEADEGLRLPFADQTFDLVINRQSAFQPSELFRVLKPGGWFLTQQVGTGNRLDLLAEFGVEPETSEWTIEDTRADFERAGFTVERAESWQGWMEFLDIGALVYYLRAIPWVVPGFAVDTHLPILRRLHHQLLDGHHLRFAKVRYLVRAQRPSS